VATVPDDVSPTDPDYENAEGRMAVWLDPEDVEWLASRCLCGPDRLPSGNHDLRCTYIRHRLTTALHKAGLKEKGKGLRRT
jgi:hypothetical protein